VPFDAARARRTPKGANHFFARPFLWNVALGKETHRLVASGGIIWGSFWPDGKTILTYSEGGALRLWDVASGKEVRKVEQYAQDVESVAYSPDGKTLATASEDHTVRLWDFAGGKGVRKLGKHADLVFSVAYSPDAKSVASGARDGSVQNRRVSCWGDVVALRGM
jgi:WD40 repeat protein